MTLRLLRTGRLVLLIAVAVLVLHGCSAVGLGPSPIDDGVTADTIFWRAYSDPTTFDSWLGTQKVHGKAAGCLQEHANNSFNLSRSKLAECSQMVSFTPTWNACHQESENYNNGGVVARDVARTVQGATRFSQTDGGNYLISVRSVVGAADWNAAIELLRQNVPQIKCG